MFKSSGEVSGPILFERSKSNSHSVCHSTNQSMSELQFKRQSISLKYSLACDFTSDETSTGRFGQRFRPFHAAIRPQRVHKGQNSNPELQMTTFDSFLSPFCGVDVAYWSE